MNEPTTQRCAAYTRAEEVDPAGTAGSHRGYVVLEVPLPWPPEITDHPDVAPAAEVLAGAGVRLQGVVPDPARAAGDRRMLTFARPDGGFDRYRTAERRVPPGDVAAALTAAAGAVGTARAAGSAGAADDRAGGPTARQVLVCTHGSRDTCCGGYGTRLATALPDLGDDTTVWRTSHTGGHRFAPTALLLPEGTAWAYLDIPTLVGIVQRSLDPEVAVRHYRGCTGLDHPEVQALEREALRSVGWAWFDHRRSGDVTTTPDGRRIARLEGTSPAGERRVFTGAVEVRRTVPVPDCGRPIADARKSAPELAVVDVACA